MNCKLDLIADAELFDTAEREKAESYARETGGVVYTWQCQGYTNWLTKGYARTDAFMLAVLPAGFPDEIQIPDEEQDKEEL